MGHILKLAETNQQKAWQIIEDTDIINIWKSIGAEINVVGSLRSGLLMKNRDIDFHIYTDPFVLEDSFSVITKLAQNPNIQKIEYKNLLQTEERCIEWHASYQDKENDIWKIDMIHILKGSMYDGYMEKVTSNIMNALTPESRETILRIKYDTPDTEKIMGIEVYYAVLEGKVRNYSDFIEWRKSHPVTGILRWGIDPL